MSLLKKGEKTPRQRCKSMVLYHTCDTRGCAPFDKIHRLPPDLSYILRVWPSGKAVDFGSTILGSNPSTRASSPQCHCALRNKKGLQF